MASWKMMLRPRDATGGASQEDEAEKVRSLPARWREALQDYRRNREKEKQDLNVYQVLSEGARPSIEYYILTVLSCLIATAGLIMGSTAVIIGAMIVAPLMTPILAFSLAIIWGDLALARDALFSLARGVILAVGISALIAALVPIPTPSPEIVSRTRPSLFDVIVALVAGVVGAYGHANRKISATIVGIAIAVALMPPLCTVGIEIGKADFTGAAGASVLFAINLVAISLSGSIVFLAMRIHPRSEGDSGGARRRALTQIVLSTAVLLAIAVPVAIYAGTGYVLENSRQRAGTLVGEILPGASVLSSETHRAAKGYSLRLTIMGGSEPGPADVLALRDAIRSRCPVFGRVDITFLRTVDIPDGG